MNFDLYTELVRESQNGDEVAFEQLYLASYPSLCKLALSILKHDEDANDAVQEAYYRIYTNLDKLENPLLYLSWAKRITCNVCLRMLETRRDIPTGDVESRMELDMHTTPDSLDIIVQVEKNSDLLDIICELDGEIRDTIILKYYMGWKISEIASHMGCSPGTVKSRIHRTKRLLKTKIEEHNSKLLMIPVSLVPIGSVLPYSSGSGSTLSTITGKELIKGGVAEASTFAKVGTVIVAGSTVVGIGTLASLPMSIDTLEPVVEIISYEDSSLSLVVRDDVALDYDSIYGSLDDGSLITPISIDKTTGLVHFTTNSANTTIYVSDMTGNESVYQLNLY